MDPSRMPCKGETGWNGREHADMGAAAEKNGKPDAAAAAPPRAAPRYWECMKNHAAGLGLHALDGCGEFMPGGEFGTLEALQCAACGCHRNFHRRDHGTRDGVPCVLAQAANPYQHPLLHGAAANPSSKLQYSFFLHPLAPPSHPLPGHDGRSGGSATPPPRSPPPPAPTPDHLSAAEDQSQQPRKRCRTMFTREQKEEMRNFAEKVGWRIQGHDGDELREFCAKVGVRRHVLKVWMHNNKSALSGAGAGPSKSDPAMAEP